MLCRPNGAHRKRARKDAGMSAESPLPPIHIRGSRSANHVECLLLEGAISMSTTNELTKVYKWSALTAAVVLALATAAALAGQTVGL